MVATARLMGFVATAEAEAVPTCAFHIRYSRSYCNFVTTRSRAELILLVAIDEFLAQVPFVFTETLGIGQSSND